VLGTPLEVALILSNLADDELKGLVTGLDLIKSAICTWLIFHTEESSTSTQWINLARSHLSNVTPDARIGSGTNANFTELNRGRPPAIWLDFVCYSMNSQVHTFDNASLMETLETQATTVESVRQFADNLPIAVSPITLKPRFNPNATALEPEPSPGELPTPVDLRQMSLLAAGWTLGSLKYLSESSAFCTTYYETSGWRGVMEAEGGSPMPERFRSMPGSVFPIYHVLADVGEFTAGEVVPTTSNNTLKVDGMAVRKDGVTRVMLANLTSSVRVHHLNETNVQEATLSPEAFCTQTGELVQTALGRLEVCLLPYAIARIDSA